MSAAPRPLVTIVRREMLTALRSWKSAALLLILILVMLYMANVAMDVSVVYMSAAGAMDSFFQAQIWCLYLVGLATVPAMAAVSLNSERRDGNFDLLVTTLIPPSRIVLGKYLAVLVYYLLFCVAVMPFTGLVYFYAGVDVYQFFDAFVWIGSAALCNAALGIWASSTYERPAQAIAYTFVNMAIVGFLAIFAGFLFRAYSYAQAISVVSNPILPFLTANPRLTKAGFQLLVGAVFLLSAMRSASRRAAGAQGVLQSMAPTLDVWRKHRTALPYLTIPDGKNPLGYIDYFGSYLRRRSAARSAFAAVVFVYLCAFTYTMRVAPGMELAIGVIERLGIMLLLPPIVAVMVVREREDTTLDMLRVTLLTGKSLVDGKLRGAILLLRPVLLGVLCGKVLGILLLAGRGNSGLFLNDGDISFGAVVWLDLLCLPLHLVLVISLALLGAVFPRSLLSAIAAASGCVFAGTLTVLFLQVLIVSDIDSGSDLEMLWAVAVSQVTLAGLAITISLGIASARAIALWEARE